MHNMKFGVTVNVINEEMLTGEAFGFPLALAVVT